MSFFGFDPTGRHDAAAPGFSQTHDPFANISSQYQDGDDLDFEETYDGLGDQLDETDDVFNDDTFGGGGDDGLSQQKVGKDFDYFNQTAKVVDALEEEHVRFARHRPAGRSAAAQIQSQIQPVPVAVPSQSQSQFQSQSAAYQYGQQAISKPVRTGYEKYKDPEPLPDLNVDQSIWGMPSKLAPSVPKPTAAPALSSSAPGGGRKIMSLEEVEAAMRAKPSPQPPYAEPAPPQVAQPAHQQYQQQEHPSPLAQHGHAQPVQILQRPPHAMHMQPQPAAPASQYPSAPAQDQYQQQQQQQHQQPLHQQQYQQQKQQQPMQILQKPGRPSGPAGHHMSGSHGAVPRVPAAAAAQPDASLSEEQRAVLLDQETKRAKRNHKIWLLSKDSGVMTPQDKNFITRIQLQQLVSATGQSAEQGTDAALSEDFYYHVYSHIRAGQRQNPSQPLSNFAQTYLFQTGGRHGNMRRHGRFAENHIQRMEQQVQRAVEAAKSKPKNPQLVIAGSLGKISFSNAKTPKPLLNIKRVEADAPRPANGKSKSPADANANANANATSNGLNRRTMLRNAEKVYVTLMKIEDHVRRIPPPLTSGPGSELELQERHRQWAAELETLNAQLWQELKVHEPIGATVPHPFIAFLSCAKGKKAIPRIFPHLSFEQRTTILTMIIYHLSQLDVVHEASVDNGSGNGEAALNARLRENIDMFMSTVMPSLMQYFNDTGLDIVDGVLNLIATNSNFELIAKTRVGVSVLTLILSRAVLLKQTGGGNAEQWEKWDQTYEILFSRLEPLLPYVFPGSINAGSDVYVWQLLAAIGVSASNDQQTRLVLAIKDRVIGTIALSKTLPATMAAERLGSVNLFLHSIGLDAEMLSA